MSILKNNLFKIKTNKLKIIESDSILIINTKQEFNWKEIFLHAIPAFLFLSFRNLILASIISLLVFITYLIFRVLAVIYYSEIKINFEKKLIEINKIKFNELRSKQIITDKYNYEGITFKKIERSGRTRYIMIYKTYKENELIIINEESDYFKIKLIFEKYKN